MRKSQQRSVRGGSSLFLYKVTTYGMRTGALVALEDDSGEMAKRRFYQNSIPRKVGYFK